MKCKACCKEAKNPIDVINPKNPEEIWNLHIFVGCYIELMTKTLSQDYESIFYKYHQA